MLRWAKKHRMLTAVLAGGTLAIALFLGSFFIPFIREMCQPNEYTHPKECPQYHLGPYVVLWTIAVIDAHNGLVSAIAGVFVAIFTATLWRTSDTQAALTRDSIELARAEFIAAHRPEIIVHAVEFMHADPSDGDSKIGARVWYFNKGGSDASIVGIDAKIARYRKPIKVGAMFPHVPINAEFISSGMRGYFDLSTLDSLNFERTRQTGSASANPVSPDLFCIGVIFYDDSFGQRRETGFCRAFNALTEQWERTNNLEYEYAY